jgi:tetratricopeptide (TPR) repeat protein
MRSHLKVCWFPMVVLVLVLPAMAHAQTSEFSPGPTYVVSARELRIPRHARDAYEKGLKYFAKNDFAESLVFFRRAVAEFPDYYEAYCAMGAAEIKLGLYEEAQEPLKKSIAVSEGHFAPPYFALGILWDLLGKPAEANELVEHGLELDPGSWVGELARTETLLRLNRTEAAEKSAHDLIRQRPDSSPAHILLANIYVLQADYRAALEEVEVYLRLEPNGPINAQVRKLQQSLENTLASGDPRQTKLNERRPSSSGELMSGFRANAK